MDTEKVIEFAKTLLGDVVDFVCERVHEWRAAHQPPKSYTYFVGAAVDRPEGYAVGESGVAVSSTIDAGGQVIDVVTMCRAGTFVIDSIQCGSEGDNMCYGSVTADYFAPSTQNRFTRFTEFRRGDVLTCRFRRVYGEEGREPFVLAFKVVSPLALTPEDPNVTR